MIGAVAVGDLDQRERQREGAEESGGEVQSGSDRPNLEDKIR